MKPTSDFYVLGGTLPRDAPSYAVRQADDDLFEGLRKGQFCYVLTSRQMGKSSLMVRTVSRLRQENVTCLVIDLTSTGQNLNDEQWYDGLLTSVALDLDLEDQMDDFWQKNRRLGPLQRWMHALKSVVLANVTGPVVIFVDEIDAVRSLPFSADEFFAAVRECYNRRTEDPEYARLTFCLLGVATPADLIRNTRSTPFNIGMRIALADFTEVEARPLAAGLHGVNPADGSGKDTLQADELLARVLYWTHGHPYLTQRLCQAVAQTGATSASGVDEICESIFLSAGAQSQDDNLLFVRENLLRADCDSTSLLTLYGQVRSGKSIKYTETDPLISTLRLAGIVRVENETLCVRNRIYEYVFDRDWVKRNIPVAELVRQRRAFRKGAFGTVAALGAVVLLFVGGFMLTHHQKHLSLHVPLNDGTDLVVNDISFGTQTSYENGEFRWGALFGRPSLNSTFAKPTLSMWLSRYNLATGKTDAFTKFDTISAVDEHGHVFMSTGATFGDGHATRVDFDNFPRRSKTIRMQLYRRPSGTNLPAVVAQEFVVPNPTTTMYPLWTPDPLPCPKSDGDLQVRLKSVTWYGPQKSSINGIDIQNNYNVSPIIECLSGGRPTSPWQIQTIQMSDATGNSAAGGSGGGSMCIFEPAWKLRLGLAQPDTSDFASSVTWTFTGIVVPKNGSVTMLSKSAIVNGVSISPLSLAAASNVMYTQGGPPKVVAPLAKNWTYTGISSASIGTNNSSVTVTGTQPQFAVSARGLSQDQKLTVWATDANGHRYNQIWSGTTTFTGKAEDAPIYFVLLSIPPGVGRVDVNVAVHKIKTVEFMVRPPLPGDKKAGG